MTPAALADLARKETTVTLADRVFNLREAARRVDSALNAITAAWGMQTPAGQYDNHEAFATSVKASDLLQQVRWEIDTAIRQLQNQP